MGRKKLPATLPAPPAVPVRGDAYQRFYDMGSERMGALDALILKDTPMAEIARTLQGEWQVFTEIKRNTLEKQIQRYRDNVLLPRVQHLREKEAAGAIGASDQRATAATRQMLERLNLMDEWTEILGIQKKRIMALYEREQKLNGVTLDGLTKLFKDYQSGLAQFGHLQLETGFLKRAPKVIQGQLGVSDPSNPDAEPIFEVAFRAQLEARAGVADMAQLLGEVIEGECERIESSSPAVPEAAPAKRKAARGKADGGAA